YSRPRLLPAFPTRPFSDLLVQLAERLEPAHALAALALPQLLEGEVVDVGLRVRLRGKLGLRRKAPLLGEQCFDRNTARRGAALRSEEHTSELQSHLNLVCS